jgi:hypothetical protein
LNEPSFIFAVSLHPILNPWLPSQTNLPIGSVDDHARGKVVTITSRLFSCGRVGILGRPNLVCEDLKIAF